MHISRPQKGFALVELLLLIAIVAIIGSYVLRVMYGSEIIRWEDNLYKSLGLEPALVRATIGILALVYFVRKAFVSKKRSRS